MSYGNTIFEIYTGSDNRYFENLAYYDQQMVREGVDWVTRGTMIESGKKYDYFVENYCFIMRLT